MTSSRPLATPSDLDCENTNLACLLWRAAEQAPDRPALRERGTLASYARLRARAAAISAALLSGGVDVGERVAVLLERGVDAVASYFGSLALGAVVVVVNERLRPRQIEHVLRHSGASVLISDDEMLARQPREIVADARVLNVGSVPARGDVEPCSRLRSDFAQIIYTSGSTGLPKGVVFTHANLLLGARSVTTYLGLTAEDRIASLLPFSSVYGLNQLLCAITAGASLVVERSSLMQQIEDALRTEEATVIAAVPPLWQQLLRVPRFVTEPMPSLRIIQNAGGHLPVDTVRRLRSALPNAQLFLQYGMTEAFRSTYLAPIEVDAHPDSIGRAIPGNEILVINEESRACGPGEIGELVHRGATVAAGYWADPEATARVFRPNPLRAPDAPSSERVVFSGDLVRRDESGLLYFVSRRDRIIKTLGFRVAPDEIADVMYASGQILECVVTGEPDAQRGERIVSYVVLAPSGSLEQLKHFCRSELPTYMQPARIDPCASLPRLPGGKYDLLALRGERDTLASRALESLAPSTRTESSHPVDLSTILAVPIEHSVVQHPANGA